MSVRRKKIGESAGDYGEGPPAACGETQFKRRLQLCLQGKTSPRTAFLEPVSQVRSVERNPRALERPRHERRSAAHGSLDPTCRAPLSTLPRTRSPRTTREATGNNEKQFAMTSNENPGPYLLFVEGPGGQMLFHSLCSEGVPPL